MTAMAATAPMPSCLPPQLIIAWLPIRDVGAALCVSKNWSLDWCAAAEPIFKAIAGRHGLQLVLGSWRATVRRYRCHLGCSRPASGLDLFLAAQSDNASRIQRLISEGSDVNHVGSVGHTALHVAAWWGKLDALNALIAAGANLNAQNWIERTENNGGTALHAAANTTMAKMTDRLNCAERLIEAGANARLLNGEEDAPYQSEFPDHDPGYLDDDEILESDDLAEESRRRFRKLLEDAFRAQR